jgi:hypothetical protein
MTAGMFAPLEDLIAEGYHVINVGADVIGMSSYVQQRLQIAREKIDQLPVELKPADYSPYA